MLTTCLRPGCTTLVLGGGACLEHQPVVLREFARGRPYASSNLRPGAGREKPRVPVTLAGLTVSRPTRS